jgi:hypothetical protein
MPLTQHELELRKAALERIERGNAAAAYSGDGLGRPWERPTLFSVWFGDRARGDGVRAGRI